MGTKGKNYVVDNDRIVLIKLKTEENDLVIIHTCQLLGTKMKK
jgi:hypothetical protein